ncbi:MAG: GAF and HD-GYP domain-containing protein [Thermoleophilia bacterium]
MTLIWVLSKEIEQRELDKFTEKTAEDVDSILSKELTAADLTQAMSPERYAEIDQIINHVIIRNNIVRVKLWRPDGMVLYSDAEEIVGQTFPVDHEFEEALNGEIVTERTVLGAEEHVAESDEFSELIEVYAPAYAQGSTDVVGVYEVYGDPAQLDASIADIRRTIIIYAGLGFLVLYMSLFGIVRAASRNLVSQADRLKQKAEENQELYRQEQQRRGELSALYDIARTLAAATPDLDENLAIVVERAVKTIHSTFAGILLLQDERLAWHAIAPARMLTHDFSLGKTLDWDKAFCCRQAMDGEKPMTIDTYEDSLMLQERHFLGLEKARSACIVPLVSGDRHIGLLLLGEERDESREFFTPEKISLATGVADQVVSAILRAELFSRLEQAYTDTVVSLAAAVDARDSYTASHSDNLTAMALAIGARLKLDAAKTEALKYGAILHDVGKIGVPDAVLNKPGKLDDSEWELMKKHAEIGAAILAPISYLAESAVIVRHHHERYGGGGYPDGIRGEDIPLGSRIITVVDSYGAMVDKRVYKKAMKQSEALAELRRCSGEQFDPEIVEIFISLIDDLEQSDGDDAWALLAC